MSTLVSLLAASDTSRIGRNLHRQWDGLAIPLWFVLIGLGGLMIAGTRNHMKWLIVAAAIVISGGFVFVPQLVGDSIAGFWKSVLS